MGSSHLRPPAEEPDTPEADSDGSSRTHFRSLSAPASDEAPTIISGAIPAPLQRTPLGAHPLELGRKLEGERLGHFELNEFIGGGGMGAVFKAVDTMLNRTVAVKVLATDQAGDPETQRRFKNEAQSAARLDHANIARVYYVGEDRGVHYIVFEYIKGTNLRDVVARRGPLTVADVIRITLQIVEALAHASERDVVHRDIKPSNVLLTPEGRAKLVDMGLARLHQVEHSQDDLTASGVTLGTFDYISPEQARDPRTADVRSDLYSLGCTMYFMLTGRPPFPEGTVLQKLLMHQGDEPPDPADVRSDVPLEMTRIVTKLLAKSPARRYQTPRLLAGDLLKLADQLGVALGDADSVSRYVLRDSAVGYPALKSVSALRRHLPWVAAICLFIAAIAWLDRSWSVSIDATKLPPLNPLAVEPTEPVPAVLNDGPGNQLPDGPGTTANVTSVPSPSPEQEKPVPAPDPAVLKPADVVMSPPNVVVPLVPDETNPSKRNTEGSEVAPFAGNLSAESFGDGLAAAEPTSASLAPTNDENHQNGARSPGVSLAVAAVGTQTIQPAVPGRPADAAAKILVVSPGKPAPAFASLRSAVAAAKSGAVIELQFTGELVERPLLLANHSLTIRAGEGFSPRLIFRPGAGDVDPNEYPRSMFSLASGQLTLINLNLELDVPRSVPAEYWALVTLRGVESLRLSRCCLTIRNATESNWAYHPNATFFRTASRSDVDAMSMEDDPALLATANLRLNDCVVRGEASFYQATANQAADIQWDNGLLATSGRAFELLPAEPGSETRGSLRADLSHLTLVNRSGLLLVAASTLSQPLPRVEINCRDSIVVGADGPSLVQYESVVEPADAKQSLAWRGNRNFYERYDVFWGLGGMPFDARDDVLRRAGWQDYWEASDVGEEIVPGAAAARFQNSLGAERAMHLQTPADYVLDPSDGNPALGAASDGGNAGMRSDSLPVISLPVIDDAGQVVPASSEEPLSTPTDLEGEADE